MRYSTVEQHSTIDLTMNVYIDPRLRAVDGAIEALPALPLDGEPETRPKIVKANRHR